MYILYIYIYIYKIWKQGNNKANLAEIYENEIWNLSPMKD